MYTFFMSLKQKDGSFMVAHHSEVDVRYAYRSFKVGFYYIIYHIAAYIACS